jgi:hypothetical protein
MFIFWEDFRLNITQTMHIKQILTTVLLRLPKKPYNTAGFEQGSSVLQADAIPLRHASGQTVCLIM